MCLFSDFSLIVGMMHLDSNLNTQQLRTNAEQITWIETCTQLRIGEDRPLRTACLENFYLFQFYFIVCEQKKDKGSSLLFNSHMTITYFFTNE